MRGINTAILVGNCGRDAEQRYTQAGKAVSNFTVATSDSWKGSDGEWQERTEWHRIVAFGKLAEIAGKYVVKGKQIYIQGKIQSRSWEDKDGNKRHTTEIVADRILLLGTKRDAPSGKDTAEMIFDGDEVPGEFGHGEEPPF